MPDQLREQDVHAKLSPSGEDCIYFGPHLQAGHQWRGQHTIVLLRDLVSFNTAKSVSVCHVLVDVVFPAAVSFLAFDSRKLTESIQLANKLSQQPSIGFDACAAAQPVAASMFDAPGVPKLVQPPTIVNETPIQTACRQRAAGLWWVARANGGAPANSPS